MYPRTVGDDKPPVYGTAELGAPVSRADFERAVRALNLSDLELRDALLKLAAHVVALTDELTRRLDGVEPTPAPPYTPAPPPTHTVEQMVAATLNGTLDQIRAQDVIAAQRVVIDEGESKYKAEAASPPCDELLHLCKAKCCTLSFSLSTEDLDEGVVRWDYGQPYLIRQRASDTYCVHNDPTSHGCTVHAYRPRVCRVYDCRDDKRIWSDYEARIPAPATPLAPRDKPPKVEATHFDLMARVTRRRVAIRNETTAVGQSYSDHDPMTGPPPVPARPKT